MDNQDRNIPDRISSSSLERITLLNQIRDSATRHGIEIVIGMLEPNGDIRLTSNTRGQDADARAQVTQRLEAVKQQRKAEKANRPSDEELATDIKLWRQYIDPYYVYSDLEFVTYTKDIKLDYIRHNGL